MVMKHRRRLLILSLLVAVVGLAGYAVWRHAFGLPRGVNPSGLARIKAGMTLLEVEGVFGKPADEYAELPGLHATLLAEGIWYADDKKAAVFIAFDLDRKVVRKQLINAGKSDLDWYPRPLLDRIRLALHW